MEQHPLSVDILNAAARAAAKDQATSPLTQASIVCVERLATAARAFWLETPTRGTAREHALAQALRQVDVLDMS